jgi:CheY-like chemotaxis protein
MRKKVLVVEDYADTRDVMAIYIEEMGYEPLLATDGKEAVEMAITHQPDIILMDISMPVMDGIEAAAIIRTIDALAETPIIAVTAHARFIPTHIKTDDFDYVLDKPFDFVLLRPIIAEFLNGRKTVNDP